jgi:hypothetical protein
VSIAVDTTFGVAGKARTDFGHTDFEQTRSALFSLAGKSSRREEQYSILNSHFFVGDLTGCNFAVVLEAGIALALKPNDRVVLFTQDDTASLHFDLKVTNVNRYSENRLVETVARVLVGAARDFEREADRYIRLLSSQLTPDGISALNIYGRLWKDRKRKKDRLSLWEHLAARYSPRFVDNVGSIAFHQAVRELSGRRLLWTDYKPNVGKGKDAYGVHATKLGWRVIEHLWSHDPQMREPGNAPTGPTFAENSSVAGQKSITESSATRQRRCVHTGPMSDRVSPHF